MTSPSFVRSPAARLLIARSAELIVVATVALALAAGTTVSLGIHRPWTTLPLTLIAGALLWIAVRPRHSPVDAEVRAAAISLAGVAAWVVVGVLFASEYLVVTRDPGFLALTGVWLIDHPSTDIPTLGAIEAAAHQANVIPDAWQAWNLAGDVVQPQGAKMLPGVLSVGGWIAGVPGVLAMNILIGGVGILAVYLLSRRMLGAYAALGPAALMALSVSHIALTRSPYSEPLTLLLIVASVSWAWRGLEERRKGALIAAGFASGATALCRIDGGVYALGVLVGVTLVCTVRGKRGIVPLLAFLIPQAIMVGAGYWSLSRWSTSYLERLGDEAHTLNLAYSAAAVALIVFQLVASAPFVHRVVTMMTLRRSSIAKVAASAMVVILAVLASRPLWMTDRRGTTGATDQFTNSVVAQFQQLEGYPIDETRTYAEHTVTWLSYYLTWPVLALATVGLGVIVWRMVTSRPAAAVFLGALAVPSAIYLLRPAIVPDQVWAIRRFEPATLPLLAIAAGVGAWWLVAIVRRAYPDWARRATITAAVIMVGAPVATYVNISTTDEYPVTLSPYLYTSEQDGARAEIDDLCDVIDGRPTILSGSSGYFGTIRVMCDVPVILALEPLEPEALALMAEEWGEQPVIVTEHPETVWVAEPAPTSAFTGRFTRGEYALQHLPRHYSLSVNRWYAGAVEADGSVTPLTPLRGMLTGHLKR